MPTPKATHCRNCKCKLSAKRVGYWGALCHECYKKRARNFYKEKKKRTPEERIAKELQQHHRDMYRLGLAKSLKRARHGQNIEPEMDEMGWKLTRVAARPEKEICA